MRSESISNNTAAAAAADWDVQYFVVGSCFFVDDPVSGLGRMAVHQQQQCRQAAGDSSRPNVFVVCVLMMYIYKRAHLLLLLKKKDATQPRPVVDDNIFVYSSSSSLVWCLGASTGGLLSPRLEFYFFFSIKSFEEEEDFKSKPTTENVNVYKQRFNEFIFSQTTIVRLLRKCVVINLARTGQTTTKFLFLCPSRILLSLG